MPATAIQAPMGKSSFGAFGSVGVVVVVDGGLVDSVESDGIMLSVVVAGASEVVLSVATGSAEVVAEVALAAVVLFLAVEDVIRDGTVGLGKVTRVVVVPVVVGAFSKT